MRLATLPKATHRSCLRGSWPRGQRPGDGAEHVSPAVQDVASRQGRGKWQVVAGGNVAKRYVSTLPTAYRRTVPASGEPLFSAWSWLSLTATAHGVLAYPDELGVRYVYDTTVPNGRYVAEGDLAVIR